jgi:hypothetical protein
MTYASDEAFAAGVAFTVVVSQSWVAVVITVKGRAMAVPIHLTKVLDKNWEDKTLQEILDAPVSALAGVSDSDADKLRECLGIRTVRDLGSNKYFAAAGVLVALANHTD